MQDLALAGFILDNLDNGARVLSIAGTVYGVQYRISHWPSFIALPIPHVYLQSCWLLTRAQTHNNTPSFIPEIADYNLYADYLSCLRSALPIV